MNVQMVGAASIRRNGATVFYEKQATDQRESPTLVFIPGWSCARSCWDDTIRELAAEWPTITIDLPGVSTSDETLRTDWSIENLGRDVAAVVEAENLADVVLIGHSMGGAVALEAANELHGKISGVIGVDCFVYPEVYDGVPVERLGELTAPLRGNFAESLRELLSNYIVAGPGRERAWRQIEAMTKADPVTSIATMEGLLSWDVSASLARSRCPVSVIASATLSNPSAAAPWRDRVRLTYLEDVGHFIMVEDPVAFSRCLRLELMGLSQIEAEKQDDF